MKKYFCDRFRAWNCFFFPLGPISIWGDPNGGRSPQITGPMPIIRLSFPHPGWIYLNVWTWGMTIIWKKHVARGITRAHA